MLHSDHGKGWFYILLQALQKGMGRNPCNDDSTLQTSKAGKKKNFK
jgi:hypothetical protein